MSDPSHSRLATGWIVVAAGWLILNAMLAWAYYGAAAKVLVGDEASYQDRSLALLAGVYPTSSFIWPPGQDFFLAAINAIAGSGVLTVQLVQIVLLIVCAWLLVVIWRALDGPRAAFFACALLLLNPSTLGYAWWLWPETEHLACLLGALALVALPGQRRLLRALLAGLLIGFALLLKSLLAAFWPVFLLFFVHRESSRWRIETRAIAGFVLALGIAVAPAMLHGWQETGRPMIADSSIYNLYVGLSETSRSDYIQEADGPALAAFLSSAPTPQARNAIYTAHVRNLLAERGWFDTVKAQLGRQYFRLFSAKTLLVSQLPGAACAGRINAYAQTSMRVPLVALAYASHILLLVMAAFGIACWRRWRAPIAAFTLLLFGYQLALYLGLHIMERYIVPMLPFLAGFGGSFIAATLRRADNEPDSSMTSTTIALTPLRLALGTALAALLLFLAFGGPLLDRSCAG